MTIPIFQIIQTWIKARFAAGQVTAPTLVGRKKQKTGISVRNFT